MVIELIVEDGSEVEGANTYVSLDDCDTYHENLGNSQWTGEDEEKKQAILRAMAWLETLSWSGTKLDIDNALEWPREDVITPNGYDFPEDAVPWQVQDAVCEAALVEIETANGLRPSLSRGGAVKSHRVEGAVSIEYFPGASSGVKYSAVSNLLRPYLKSTTAVRRA